MNFNSMKVAHRLAVAFGIVLVIVVLTSAYALTKLARIEANLEDVVLDNNVKISINTHLSESVHITSRLIRTLILMSDPAEKEEEVKKIEKARADYDAAWEALQKFPASEQGKALRAKIAAKHAQTKAFNARVMDMALKDRASDAVAVLLTQASPVAKELQDAIDENLKFQEANNQASFEDAQAEYKATRTVLIAADLLAIALAVFVGWRVTRSITTQLGGEPETASDLARNVSQGDMTAHIALASGDTTSLLAQLKTMQEGLVRVVSSVRQGFESVATASAEIAQGNNDLSARTEQQASALEETAASMEELSSTVKQNADSARQANQLAMNASTVAVQGGEVVAQVVDTMKGINDSSRKIADIISVIDGIAFQTNILALNAAVEAARAGEQGRGFAVVASEVRSLAGRSAEAAKEIKTLINASVERVEHGTNLVDKAGSTMTEVVNSIRRVTDIMGEISAASAEQAAGVAQVGEAVSQMDQVTQQNAALVEEMAAAASSLKSQANELVQTVAVFKLGAGDQGTNLPKPRAHSTAPSAGIPKSTVSHSPAARPKLPPQAPAALPKPAAPKTQPKPAPAGGDEDWETF